MYRVICEDGVTRHASDFPTESDARAWAETGHVCTSNHATVNVYALNAAQDALSALQWLNQADGRFAQGAPSSMPFAETSGALHAIVAELLGSDTRAARVIRVVWDADVTVERSLRAVIAEESDERARAASVASLNRDAENGVTP